MKIAIVHDYLNQYGGAERVLEVLIEMFPEADLYSLFYSPQKLFTTMPLRLQNRAVVRLSAKAVSHRLHSPANQGLVELAAERWHPSMNGLLVGQKM